MRKTLVLMVATLALLLAWSAIGQEMQESLSLDSELEAPVAITDFLNGSDNDTVNETQNASLVDANLSTTTSQDAFLDLPVNTSLIDTNLSTTTSQGAFLDLPVNTSLIDTNLSTTTSQGAFLDLPVNTSLIDTDLDMTDTQEAFLLDTPIEQPTSFFKKHQMMGT